ncbi:MAG: N-acetylmuramoyl-L-alanine amidase [Ruminiclostridium sp.]|nr:N-acetylmuramoyl-L-alanine amidase [Ruminiclostridium sp.]
MPIIYLSPSTQEFNPYVTTGNEDYWMNRLADTMEPILTASGIAWVRNTPDMTAASSIRASNAGIYDLHLALHSNASGGGMPGRNRGIIAFYFPSSSQGQRAAQLIAENLKPIYPLPNLVRAEPTTTLGEVRRVRAPAVLLELGFHDNDQDANWITANIHPAAEAIVLALTEFFSLPFFPDSHPEPGRVQYAGGAVSVYDRPAFTTPKAFLYDGAPVTILNRFEDWALIRFGGELGFLPAEFLSED